MADAWAAAADDEPENPEPIGLLIVSGDEAAADPNVRAMAEQSEKVIAIGMFRRLVAPWADLILPGTSYLERDGTYVNLEGRLQRIRRAAIPPAPDEVAVLSRLAERFGVELSPYPAQVFDEVSAICFGGLPYGEVGEQARLHARVPRSQVQGQSLGRGSWRKQCQTLVVSPRDRLAARDLPRRSSPGPPSSACRSSSSSAPPPRSSSRAKTPAGSGSPTARP